MASQFLLIAERVLTKEKRPLSAKEIVALAVDARMFSDRLSGRTPHQTMKSKLSVDIRRKGETSIFVRTAPGKFFLRSLLTETRKEYAARPLTPPPTTESVLVIDSQGWSGLSRFQGVRVLEKGFLGTFLDGFMSSYVSRIDAEQNDFQKQILTYVLVKRGDKVLGYKRGTYNRVEDFLRGSRCIGFGGHVTEQDRQLFDPSHYGIYQCAARELTEELRLPAEDRNRLANFEGLLPIGLLNDDSSPVGRRHLAVIFEYIVSESSEWESPARGEKSITQLRWLDPGDPDFDLWDFEYWSQLCFSTFFKDLTETVPKHRIVRKRPLRPPHLLCISGSLGSGKSEATAILKNEYGYDEINSGRILAQLLEIPPIPETPRSTFQRAAWNFITQDNGPRILAEAIHSEAKAMEHGRVLIGGIRQQATLEQLRALSSGFRFGHVFVHTMPHIAFDFFRLREGQFIDPDFSIFDFLELRNNPVEQEVGRLIRYADAVLYNWTGRSEYQKAIRSLVEGVMR